MTKTQKDIEIQLTKLKFNVNFIADKLGLLPIGSDLKIETWTPGDSQGTRYQLGQTEPDHSGCMRWQGRYYTAKEMDGALELANKLFNELIYPLEVNKKNG